jgi:hypothetical protein
MKKVILSLVAVVALAFGANAQTDKGSMFIGGTLGFSSEKVEGADESATAFEIAPRFGYFVADNFAIGLGVGFTSTKEAVPNAEAATSFFVNPFARYYVPTAGENFKFFAELGVNYSTGDFLTTQDGIIGAFPVEASAFGVNLSPNFAFFPASNWAIEFGIRGLYFDSINPEGDDNNITSFGLDARSLTPRIGINFFF